MLNSFNFDRQNGMHAGIDPVTVGIGTAMALGGIGTAIDAIKGGGSAPQVGSTVQREEDVQTEAHNQAINRYDNEIRRLSQLAARGDRNAWAQLQQMNQDKDRIIGETAQGLMGELGAKAERTTQGDFLEQERQALFGAQSRQQQADLGSYLMAQARGEAGPSAAEIMLQRQQGQNLRNALALSRSQAGLAPGLAARQAQQSASSANLDLAGQAAQLRAAEQLQAQQLAAGVLGQTRGQDAYLTQLGMGIEGQRLGANQFVENLELQRALGNQAASINAQNRTQQGLTNLGAGLLQGGGYMLAQGMSPAQPQTTPYNTTQTGSFAYGGPSSSSTFTGNMPSPIAEYNL